MDIQGITTNKAATALALMLVMMPGVFIESASANIIPYQPPRVSVLSPSPNGSYHSPNLPLKVRVQLFGQTPQSLEHLNSLNYSLDDQQDAPILFEYPSSYGPGYYLDGNGTLSGLADGVHSLTVQGETTIGAEKKYFNATISFTVDTTFEPFPLLPVAAVSVVVLAAVAVAVLVYLKKRKN